MIEEPEAIATIDPAIQEARRVAFMICTVEQEMGIDNGDLPLKARLENILQGAMMNPAAIGPGVFGLLFKMANVPKGVEPDGSGQVTKGSILRL